MEGESDADQWAELNARLAEMESEAAAEASAVEKNVRELEAAASANEASGEAARRLAELRAAIAGEVSGGRDLDAVRAAVTRLFDKFELFRVEPEGDLSELPSEARAVVESQQVELATDESEAIDAGEYVLLPYPTVATEDEFAAPIKAVLRRQPLDLASDKDAGTLTT